MQVPLSSIVKQLATTPTEIVCEILDDLRIWDVLRLICHNNPAVNHSILVHRWYGKLFEKNIKVLSDVSEIAQMYWDFGREMRWQLAPLDSPLALLTNTPYPKQAPVFGRSIYFQQVSPSSPNWALPMPQMENDEDLAKFQYIITKYMQARIASYLGKLAGKKVELLACYSKDYEFSSIIGTDWSTRDLRLRWDTFRDAQSNLVQQRVQQLSRAAEILEANSDILKLASDPGQHRRKNIGHIIGNIRKIIERMSQTSMIRGDWNTGASYFFVYFPVVPFDACLRVVLQRLSATTGTNIVAVSSESGSQHEIEETNTLKIFLTGLESIYAPTEKWRWTMDEISTKRSPAFQAATQIPRVIYEGKPYKLQQNPYTSNLDFEEMKFVSGYEKYHRFLPHSQREGFRENRIMAWDKHDDRELEWLEAFVKLYRLVQEHS